MRLESLRVIHFSKAEGSLRPDLGSFASSLEHSFYLNSCQRMLWVDFISGEMTEPGFETFFGVDAYSFLLKVATGLESQVAGETDIFGQIKDAWKKFKSNDPLLSQIMQKLFEDTKEIRTHYMQNLGGSSYGSLVRKLLREKGAFEGTTLLIGAGQLAESVAPYLLDQKLFISNRTPSKAFALAATLLKQNPDAQVHPVSCFKEEMEILSSVARVIVAIPVEIPPTGFDAERIALLKNHPEIQVLHLGTRTGESKEWASLERFHSLDAIFEIERSQCHLRSRQVERARAACHERAKLREMGAAFLAHGWEDLAVFA
jgi:glutamyl-tRNA reductase